MNSNNQENRFPEGMLSALKGAGSILLCGHVSPDGDTVGSCLALRLALAQLGKRADFALEMPVPRYLCTLPGAKEVLDCAQASQRQYDVVMAVDVSEQHRMGNGLEGLFEAAPVTLQLDHHATNPFFASINCVEGDASATGVLAYRLICALGAKVDSDMAACLYAAIATDTGNFSFSNVNEEAFIVAGELMNSGLKLSKWSTRLFRVKEKPHVRLLGRALSGLTYFADGKGAAITLSAADFEKAGAKRENTEGIVSYGIESEDVVMAFLAYETDEGRVKVSLRAVAPYRADLVAAQFQGGGHTLASGCTLTGTLEEAKNTMIAAMEKAIGETQA